MMVVGEPDDWFVGTSGRRVVTNASMMTMLESEDSSLREKGPR
jgi:hypothetical protein